MGPTAPKYTRTTRAQQAAAPRERERPLTHHTPFLNARNRPFTQHVGRGFVRLAERAAQAAATRKERARLEKRGLRAHRAMLAAANTQALTVGSTQPPNRRARKNAERVRSDADRLVFAVFGERVARRLKPR